MFFKNLYPSLILLLIIGCDGGGGERGEFDSADIYYRKMDSLSPVSFSEEMLRESAVIRISINNASDIQVLRDNLPKKCNQEGERPKSDLDIYLVIDFSKKNGQKQKFSSSQLDYYYGDDPDSRICGFSMEERDRLSEWIESRERRRQWGGATPLSHPEAGHHSHSAPATPQTNAHKKPATWAGACKALIPSSARWLCPARSNQKMVVATDVTTSRSKVTWTLRLSSM